MKRIIFNPVEWDAAIRYVLEHNDVFGSYNDAHDFLVDLVLKRNKGSYVSSGGFMVTFSEDEDEISVDVYVTPQFNFYDYMELTNGD